MLFASWLSAQQHWDIHAVVMLFASWLSAQQLWPPYLGWQGHNSLIAIVSYHHDKMWKRKNVSSSDWYWTFDVRRQEIELIHQGPLKMAIRLIDAKFNTWSGTCIWKKKGWIGVFFPFLSQIKTPLVIINFDSWFSE